MNVSISVNKDNTVSVNPTTAVNTVSVSTKSQSVTVAEGSQLTASVSAKGATPLSVVQPSTVTAIKAVQPRNNITVSGLIFGGGGGAAGGRDLNEDGSITQVVEDTSPQLGNNLDVNGYTITSASGGPVVIDPDGNGDVLFRSNGTDFVAFKGANYRVGIGTTTPDTKFQVEYDGGHTSGTIGVANAAIDLYNPLQENTDEKGSIITFSDNYEDQNGFHRTTRAAIKGGTDVTGNTANGFLAFYTDYSAANSAEERMRIDKDGKVGIGTSSPSFNLSVVKDSNDARIEVKTTTAGAYFRANSATENYYGLEFTHGTTQHWFVGGYGSSALEFVNGAKSNGTRAMVINQSNNVGIGTTTPAARLGLEGDGALLDLDNDSSNNSYLRFRDNGTSKFAFRHITGSDYLGVYDYGESSDTMVFKDGKVGIGTTDPYRALDVRGIVRASSVWGSVGAQFRAQDPDTNVVMEMGVSSSTSYFKRNQTDGQFRFRNSANYDLVAIDMGTKRVGINTDNSPDTLFHVKDGAIKQEGTDYFMTINHGHNIVGSNHLFILGQSSYLHFRSSTNSIYHDAAQGHVFRNFDGTTEYARLMTSGDTAGNFGIGTNSPSRKLEVSGAFKLLDENNSVLITGGTETTATNVVAVGLRALEYSGNRGVAVGVDAGRYTTGLNNTLVGHGAGYGTSDSTFGGTVAVGTYSFLNLTTGSGNTAVGYSAGKEITTGSYNQAFGHHALETATGSYNIGVGFQAGHGSASYNVSVGHQANHHHTGNNNVAIGYEALTGVDGNATASNTVAVGYKALTSLQGADGNSAFGHGAQEANTTGQSNTAVGTNALGDLTTAANNVAVGRQALGSANTANNVGVGFHALKSITGTNNIGIGFRAGEEATNNNTLVGHQAARYNVGGNNTIIGYEAGYGTDGGSTYTNTTAVGAYALNDLTTGEANTAFGYQALSKNTTGNYSTSIGYGANRDTTGNSNTAVGIFAGLDAGAATVSVGSNANQYNTANNAVAVGYAALKGVEDVTASAAATAVGYEALRNITTASNATAVGYNAGKNITTGNNLTAVGTYALISNTSGIDNTAVGRSALYYNTTGRYNVSVGTHALQDNATGDGNVAIGRAANKANTSGDGNVLIGWSAGYGTDASDFENVVGIGRSALQNLTTGDENVAVGYFGGHEITTGVGNTLMGYQSGKNVVTTNNNSMFGRLSGRDTTGDANNFFGASSGLYVTTGNNNVAIGWAAMRGKVDTTTASNNNAIGYRALYQIETGSTNQAVGRDAGYALKTGGNNVFFGHEAGYSVTGSGNVMLGYRAGKDETGSNKLYIANSETTTPLIYGDFSAAKVGIGVSSPQATLDVDGTIKLKRETTAPTAVEGALYADDSDNLYFGIA